MSSHEPQPSPKAGRNREVAWLLASGMTQREVRAQTGCSERTIRRLLVEPSFQTLLHRARRERYEEVDRKLPNLADEAVDALGELMRSASDTVRLGAIRTILGMRQRLDENELINRMNQLERAVLGEAEWTPDVLDDETYEADDDVDY